MIGNTNSVIAIGGNGQEGDKICVSNYSGEEITEGDKVLLQIGNSCFEQTSEFDLQASSSTCVNPVMFLNDYTFIGSMNYSRLTAAAIYSFYDGIWHQTAEFSFGNILGSHHLCHHLLNNTVVLSPVTYYSSYSGHIIQRNSMITLPSNCAYLGEYNNVHYAWSYAQAKLYEYDIENNALGNVVYTASGGSGLISFLVGDKVYMSSGSGNFFVIQIKEDQTVELLKNAFYSSFYPLYFVGSGVGDYILATNNLTWYQGSLSTPPSEVTNLVFYRLNDDYSLSKVTLPIFRKFLYETCMVSYDALSHILCVGTKSEVCCYFYDENNHEFVQLPMQVQLPEANGQWCYQPCLSPHLNNLVIGYMTGSYTGSFICYRQTKIEHAIVPNDTDNYFALTGYSAVVDSKTEDEKYEVKTALLDAETITVETNETADQIEFMGEVL